MAFEFHDDVVKDHPVFSTLSLGAFGLWVLAGTWTSANKSPGYVPDSAANGFDSSGQLIGELVESGAWTRETGGYRMEFGPGADLPLPVWRYGDTEPANGFFEKIPDPER